MALLSALGAALTPRRLAQVAIILELVVVARVLGEIFRLKAVSDGTFTFDAALVYLGGGLIALGFLACSIVLYFAGRDRLSGIAAVVMVVVLIAYKAIYIGLG